jgi:dolichol-phosphate mannosyltransferase
MKKTTHLPALSVIVPVKNEAENVASLVGEIAATLTGAFQFEIIYVNDGSTDKTLQNLKDLRETTPELRIFTHVESRGQSAAVHTGVQQAKHDWIAVLDGDGQNDPADLHTLWNWITAQETPHCMAIGRRTKRQDDGMRKFASRCAADARRWLLKDGVPDSGCGIKILHRETFLSLPYFDHMHRFMPTLMARIGAKVASIPVAHRSRTQGVSKYGTLDRALVGVVDILGVLWLKRRYKVREIIEETLA